MIKEPVAVGVLADQDEVAEVVAHYNLLAVPVVDDEGRLAGIVTVDDAIDTVLPTAWKRRPRRGSVGRRLGATPVGDGPTVRRPSADRPAPAAAGRLAPDCAPSRLATGATSCACAAASAGGAGCWPSSR